MVKVLIQNGSVYEIFGETAPELHKDFLVVDAPDDVECGWEYVDGVFTAPTKYLPSYSELRAMEYPPITDYLDGIVKGDQAQIDKYIADCLAVKAKYPKTEDVGG